MLRHRSDQAFLSLLCVVDLAVTSLCWLGTYYIRWNTGWFPEVDPGPPFWWCVRTLPIVLVTALLVVAAEGPAQDVLLRTDAVIPLLCLVANMSALLATAVVGTSWSLSEDRERGAEADQQEHRYEATGLLRPGARGS